MAVDAASLRILILGDDRDYQAAARRTQESLKSIESHVNQAGSAIGSSFNKAGAALSQLGSQVTTTAGTFERLKSEIQKNESQLTAWSSQIAQNRIELANLKVKLLEAAEAGNKNSEESKKLKAEYDKLQAATQSLVAQKSKLLVENRGLVKSFEEVKTEAAKVPSTFDRIKTAGKSLSSVGTQLSIGLTAPLVLLGREVIKAGSSFETAFAGVRKTVNATEPELAQMSAAFRRMAQEIPITANELAKIGEAAGQLGIKNENIVAFTRTMADLGVTTNLTSDQAATMLARFANITGMAREANPEWQRLGSTIVELGNNFATTEREITEMGLRLAGAGAQIGLTEAQILGMATALSSVGIEAEAGGSAFSRVMLDIQAAVQTNSKELKIFAQVAGQSVADFKRSFQTDAAGAVTSFVTGLKRMSDEGHNVVGILEKLDLNNIRVRDALLRTANAGDLLSRAMQIGTRAWQENTAITKEAAERYKTFESQLQIVKNKLTDVSITLFNALRPALIDAINLGASFIEKLAGLAKWFADLPGPARTVALAIAGIAAVAGPLLFVLGQLAQTITAVRTVALMAAPALAGLSGSITATGAAAGAAATGGLARFAAILRTLPGMIGAAGIAVAGFELTGFGDKARKQTEENTEKLRKALKEQVGMYEGQGKAMMDVASKGIEGLTSVSNEKYKQFFQSTTQTIAAGTPKVTKAVGDLGKMTKSELQKGLNEAFSAGDSKLVDQYLKALDNLEQKGKPAGGGAGKALGKSILDGIDAGLSGFDSALSSISKKLESGELEKLFDPMSKAARRASEQTAKELKLVTDAVNDYLQSVTKGVKITEAELARMDKNSAASLLSLAGSWKKVQEAQKIATIEIASLTIKQRETIDVAAEHWFRFSEKAKKAIKDLGVTVNVVFPAMKLIVADTSAIAKEKFEVITSAVEAFGKKAKQAFEETQAAAPHWAGAIVDAANRIKRALEDSAELVRAKAQIEIRQSIESAIKTFEELGRQAGKTGDDLVRFVREKMATLPPEIREHAQALLREWEQNLVQLPGIWNQIFGKLKTGTKEGLNEIFAIIDLLPGKIGDSLRRAQSEFERWFQIIDSVVKVVQRAFGDNSPSGIIGIIQKGIGKIFGLFQKELPKATVTFQTVLEGLGGAASKATQEVGKSSETEIKGKTASAFGVATAAVGAFATGLSVAAATGSKAMGAIAGAVQGALSGFAAGGPIGAIIGGVGGLLGGLFGGKSKAQKEAERQAAEQRKLEIERLKQDLAKGTQEVLQAGLETVQKAVEAFEKLADFGGVPKKAMQMLFAALRQMMTHFVEFSRQFKADALEQAKKAAENISAVVDLIGSAVDAFEGLRSFRSVPERAIAALFSALDSALAKFEELTDDLDFKWVKRAGKYAAKLKEVVGLISEATDAFKKVAEFSGVPKENLQKLFDAIEDAALLMGRIVESVDRIMINKSRAYARNIREVVGLISEAADAFTKIKEFSDLPRQQLQLLFDGILVAAELMIAVASKIKEELLSAAVIAAADIREILTLLQEAVEAFKAIASFESVPREQLQLLFDSIQLAAEKMTGIVSVIEADLLQKAAKYGGLMVDVISHLRDAAEIFNAITQFKNLPAEQLSGLLSAIEQAIFKIAELADSVDKKMLKAARKFADKIAEVLDSILRALQAFNALTAEAGNPTSVLETVLAQFESAVRLVEELADRASEIQATLVQAAAAIASGVEAFTSTPMIPTLPETFPVPFEPGAVPVPIPGGAGDAGGPGWSPYQWIVAAATTTATTPAPAPTVVVENHYHFYDGAVQIKPDQLDEFHAAIEWAAALDETQTEVRTTQR